MRMFGPTRLAKQQALLHVVFLLPLVVLCLLLASVASAAAAGLAAFGAWSLSRPFRRAITVSPTGVVSGHDRIGATHALTPARAGVRATLGLHAAVFVPIVIPSEGRSLTLWSLASSSHEDAEVWVNRLFAGTGVAVDRQLHG